MTRIGVRAALVATLVFPAVRPAQAQAPADSARQAIRSDSIRKAIRAEGMDRSQAEPLAQELMDVIGPRLTASPAATAANDWAIARYAGWGIPARQERYGTWNGWRRGITHLDLVRPREQELEATMLAWSRGTGGRSVEGEVVLLPEVTSADELNAFLERARGTFVMTSSPQASCRSPQQWAEFATPESRARLGRTQDSLARRWNTRARALSAAAGPEPDAVLKRFRAAGVAGLLLGDWSRYPGIRRAHAAPDDTLPTLVVTCEDYGLLWRLAAKGEKPRVRLTAESHFLGEQPVFNTIAEIRGSEKPNEYVVLSAHFDSWDGATGATDNGTGTIMMMEAMRILRTTYPHPKRTIVAGHWQGEEQGTNGSLAFAEDHPEVIAGLHALFNQDNGTGRIIGVGPSLLRGMAARLEEYLAVLPRDLAAPVRVSEPGMWSRGSDHESFACRGVPAVNLNALSWDYSYTTWHSNRDTFDKVVIDDLKNNATLMALLAFQASEDPRPMSRERMDPMPVDRATGQPMAWPACAVASRRTP